MSSGARPSRLALALAVVAVIVTACGGGTTRKQPSESVSPEAGGSASTSVPSKPGDGKAPGGKVAIVRQLAIPWQSEFGMVDIIIEIRNEGARPAQINGGAYTMYSKSGAELDKGVFLYAFPKFLAPGATGYIAERDYSSVWNAADVGTVKATFDYDWIDEARTYLTTADIATEKDPYGSGGYITSGTVTNRSDVFVPMAHIGVFYLAADGTPLGFTYTNLVENVAPGQTKNFTTVGESPPMTSWDKTVVVAVAD